MKETAAVLHTLCSAAHALNALELRAPGVGRWTLRYRMGWDRRLAPFREDDYWIEASRHPDGPDLAQGALRAMETLDQIQSQGDFQWG